MIISGAAAAVITSPSGRLLAGGRRAGRSGRRRPGRRGDQRGSGTLLIMLVVVIMLALAASFGVVGQYLVAGQRARAAADLAALAGAQTYGTGADGCAAAKRFATENGQRMTNCATVGDRSDFVLTVTITAPVPVRSPILPDTITVESHAGPVRT